LVPAKDEIEVQNLASQETHADPVNDEIAQGNLHSEDPVLQLIGEQVEVSSNDDGEDILMVSATQLVRVVNDEEFDDVVQKELQVVKKLWADMAEAKQGKQEESFTPFVSKSQKKKNKNLARSAGQPYHTCSKGAPRNMSL
ncbi:hypothetical protein A2U01_0053424, partial [Trifolium medium]|nr:hypothetical protein [Trifolium medium]